MNDQQLERNLQSVGMACFVKYFDEFANPSLPNDVVAGILLERECYPVECREQAKALAIGLAQRT